MMIWVSLGIVYLGYCVIGGVVTVSAWGRLVAEDPAIEPGAAVGAAFLEGTFWPLGAWRTFRGRGGGDV